MPRCTLASTPWRWLLIVLVSAGVASAQASGPAGGDVAVDAPAAEAKAATEADARLKRLAQTLVEGNLGQADSSAGEPAPVPPPQPNRDPAPDRDAAPAATPLDPIELTPLGSSSNPGAATPTFSADGSWILNTLTALGLVIGLILLLRWGWARMGGTTIVRSSPVVEVLSRTAVAPRNHILLVRVGQRILVVSDSPGGLRTLADLDDAEEVAELLAAVTAARDNSISRTFSQLLNRFNGEYEGTTLREEGGDTDEHLLDRSRDGVSGLLSRIRVLAGRGGVG